MLDHSGLTRRQRWMLYPIYGAAALVCLTTLLVFLTLNGTRDFIGEKGVEICWMYGSFERYLFAHFTSTGVSLITLSALYWLARRDQVVAYVGVWAMWLLYDVLLSFFGLSFC
jgi:hypothetical protein